MSKELREAIAMVAWPWPSAATINHVALKLFYVALCHTVVDCLVFALQSDVSKSTHSVTKFACRDSRTELCMYGELTGTDRAFFAFSS